MKKKHPGSENLKVIRDAETANARRLKGLEVRRENIRLRAEQAERIEEEKERLIALSKMADEGFGPHEIMKANMIASQIAGDIDTANKLAKELGEYDKPKLTRTESTTVVKSVKDLTDEELKELIELEAEFKKG